VSVLSAVGSNAMFGASRWLDPMLNGTAIAAATSAAPMDSFLI
jgi:hypothetical protein